MSANNREFFRVEEEAYVIIKYVPKNNIRQVAADISASMRMNNLATINKNIKDGLALINGRNRQLAQLMASMDEKMDYILRVVEGGSMEETKIQPINLSSGGCRFYTTEVYGSREVIDITIRFTNLVEVRALAMVVFSKPASDTKYGTHEMACEFKAISKSHKEAIDTRVMDRQQQDLKVRHDDRYQAKPEGVEDGS